MSDTEEEDESDNEKNDDDCKNVEANKDDEQVVNIGDIEPSLRKVEEAMDEVEKLLLRNKTSNLKCNKCDFEAKNSNGLTMHIKAKHPDTSS